MGAKNMVIAGDYAGRIVSGDGMTVMIPLSLKVGDVIRLNKNSVDSYEVINTEQYRSAASGFGRGLIGGALFGNAGMMAGVMSAKSKGIYQIAIQFKDGKKSLIEVDDKIYKALVKSIF